MSAGRSDFIESASNDPWHVMRSVTVGCKEEWKRRAWAFWLRGTLITKRAKRRWQPWFISKCRGLWCILQRHDIMQLAGCGCLLYPQLGALMKPQLWFFFSPSSLQTQTLWQCRASHFRASLGKFWGQANKGLLTRGQSCNVLFWRFCKSSASQGCKW